MAQGKQSRNASTTATESKGQINRKFGRNSEQALQDNNPFAVIARIDLNRQNRLRFTPSTLTRYDVWCQVEYSAPHVIDMIMWRTIHEQRDEVVIRAYEQGYPKAGISRRTGISRKTVDAIIRRHLSKSNSMGTSGEGGISGDGIFEYDLVSAYPQQIREEITTEEQR